MILVRNNPERLEKAKYIKRWKGKDGKWQYQYRGKLKTPKVKKETQKTPQKMKKEDLPENVIYHTSPEKIKKIDDRGGNFQDSLFFSTEEYNMSVGKTTTYALDIDNMSFIDPSDFFYEDDYEKLNDIVKDIQNYAEVDEEKAQGLLDGSEDPYDLIEDGEMAGELSWYLQGKQGEASKKLGYDGALSEDEQGSVYIIPMLNREKDLIEVIEDGNINKSIIVKSKTSGLDLWVRTLSNKHKVPREQIEKEILAGQKEEMEHTTDRSKALKIAVDHVSEDPEYYKKLSEAGLLEKSISGTKFGKEFKKMFSDDNGKINIYKNKYKLMKLKHFPRHLDLENCEILYIRDDVAAFAGGGDWQEAVNFSIQWKNGQMEICNLYRSEGHDGRRKINESFKELDQIEKAKNNISKQDKFSIVMKEFYAGELKSNGKVVTDRKQAQAIAASEAGMSKSIIVKAISQAVSKMRELKQLVDPPAEYDRKYKLQGHTNWHGLKIAIENKKGTYRTGTAQNGKKWKTLMDYDYGRICGTKATDSEAVDIFVGPDDTADMVYVVHQVDPLNGGRYDEDKCLINFPSRESAIIGYQNQYDRPDYLGKVSEFTIPQFKEALKEKKGTMLYRSPIMVKSRIIVRGKTAQ